MESNLIKLRLRKTGMSLEFVKFPWLKNFPQKQGLPRRTLYEDFLSFANVFPKD